MYNRYIPQADGSYRRNPTQEPHSQTQRATPPVKQSSANHSNPPPPPGKPPTQSPRPQPPRSEPISGFLRQLIPKGFDTGDLIIVLLLLLMAGDNPEHRSNALLTLALYFVL